MSWSAVSLSAAGLPRIEYPIPLSAFAELLSRGGVPPVQLLAWLQLFSENDLVAWTCLGQAMTGIARQLATAYQGRRGEIEGPNWRLSLESVDLSREIVTVQRDCHLVAAIADRGDGWLSVSHYRALDAKAARYLTGLGAKPGPDGTVAMRPSAFEYAKDCSAGCGNGYASARGESYLSYWDHGVGLDVGRMPVQGWIEQRTLAPLPWAELAIELVAQAVLDESSWVDPTRMPAIVAFDHGSPMQSSETLATYAEIVRRDRAIGALIGLAVGDAVGTTLEFTSRDTHPPLSNMIGGGPFRLERGQWTDDTSMALCLAESLLAKSRLDPLDLMQRFCRWRDQGENSCTGSCFDIGGTVSAALSRFERTGDPLAGSSDPNTAGNGSLMRLSPIAIFWHAQPEMAEQAAAKQSRTTHAAPAAVDACRVFARLLVRAIAGEPKRNLLAPWPDTAGHDRAVAAVMAGSWRNKRRDQIQSTGYVVHSLEAALWAVDGADDFRSAVLTAANLGGDADTVAAITGQLAGALWGCSGIPESWRTYLAWSTKIRDLAAALFEAGDKRRQTTSSNRTLFDRLCGEGRINVVRAPLFDQPPPSHPMSVAAERVRGMLLGLAIGDALGNTSESLLPEERRRRYGEIRDYLPNRYAEGRKVGLPSDDTQLAFWTLELLLESGQLDVDELARRFSERRIFGIGQSVRTFLRNYKAGQEWPEAAARSAGNGSLMRIAPVLVPHLRSPGPDLWVDAALCAAITHNDPASIAACVAFVGMLWQLLGMRTAPTPEWWVEAYVDYARPLEGKTRYRPRGGAYEDTFEGSLWNFVAERLPQALAARKSARTAADEWQSGAYLLETVPTALYLLMLHADDPEEAMVRAVNDSCDNDTIAAIVGAAVGALHGEAALPRRWRENLLGRTAEADDGRVFTLLSGVNALL